MGDPWVSLSTEIRPSKNTNGAITEQYVVRKFTYKSDNTMEGVMTYSEDPQGTIPSFSYYFRGHS